VLIDIGPIVCHDILADRVYIAQIAGITDSDKLPAPKLKDPVSMPIAVKANASGISKPA